MFIIYYNLNFITMKTTTKNLLLAILIFIACYSYGQDTIFWNESPIELIMQAEYDYRDSLLREQFNYKVVSVIIRMYDEYAIECYNDSTYQAVVIQHRVDNDYTPFGSVWEELDYEYTHRQPTFNGFIEYLRNRLNN